MRTTLAIGAATTLAVLGGAYTATAASPQSPEDAAESSWETYVAASYPAALPGTLSCAVEDGDGPSVATCFALAGGEDGSPPSVIVGRSMSTDGATWNEFEEVPVTASTGDGAVSNPAGDGFPMPDAVGMNLQQAQDLLQERSGNFLYYSSSEDATDQGRMQLIDSNWLVCSQNITPGASVTADLNVIFYVVKDDESCP